MAQDDLIEPVIGVIGGSGLYEIEGLENREWRTCETPWGRPSDDLLFGTFDGVRCVFLPRHGRGHPLPPSRLNYRANIDVLKRAGVTDIISLSSVGSLKEELAPGHFVLPDQLIDQTRDRPRTFFEEGCVAQISMANPFSSRLLKVLGEEGHKLDMPLTVGGTYVTIEGPQFDTRAESELYRSWGASVVGMTAMPEAVLAREAEINYAVLAMVGDYDSWHASHNTSGVENLLRIRQENSHRACELLRKAIPILGQPRPICPTGAERALDHAIITPADMRHPALLARLDAVAGRVLFQNDDWDGEF
ncbi:S-methyl-5'-thioadenosine phosphorylase [Oecophyllibacter saccharovorans]|uniref:S-methyl-5'-thioadenosine phosphorylase n=1 Tax=Oecophyllibacter saccharovorans TaxID=2558360 RepID=UPI001144C19F|nr:S-methyl-5'-thioadenosine phosphorylase [Oecophyllibacter saccharovorans]QDH15711.1 S-methyl-5'-thioadenosine phosphorylase [Oecophyllibacter saccharovorans]TPW36732.1 S-methyl-5'-thioadenosine phosphorylase [Oecophyllibacter saccharovorans]